MRKFALSLVLIIGCPAVYCQTWVQVPIQLNFDVKCLYTDTVDNLLYLGGMFGLNDTDTVRGVATWDNNTISGCAEGLMNFMGGNQCGVPLSEIVRFQDKIYVGGGATLFTVGDSVWTRGIGVWDGVAWDSIHVGLVDEFGQPSGVTELEIINDELYVGSSFLFINGTTQANGLAKFDGNNWTAVHDFPQWGGTSVNVVRHIAEYNGEIYVAGQLTDAYPYDTMYNICRFNGSEWEQLGEGIGGGFSEVLGMEIYQGKLYVYGSFSKNDRPLNPGNRIAVWNGAYWEQVVDIQGSYAYVNDMVVHNNEIYVVGSFEYVNGYPASNFAKFDGVDWCTYPDVFDLNINQIEVYQDELYISGLFTEINGTPFQGVAKFNPNSTPTNCVSVVNVFENNNTNFVIYPNPASENLTISSTELINQIEIIDLFGRSILVLSEINAFETTLDLIKYSNGNYIVKVSTDSSTEFHSLVKN